MKRREFLKKTAAVSGAISVPYILPSGSIMARTQSPMAGHVVFVLFAGGVRQQEAVLKRYLAESQDLETDQDLSIEGNIMYNMLTGDPPDLKIVYGQTSPDGQPGGQPISPILSTPLDQQGTLFQEVSYSFGGTGHFGGLSTGVSGFYGITQGLQQRPVHPTVFEYLRKFGGFKATDTWFIGNGIGNSTPLLNHSEYPGFGSDFGANFFAPNITFGAKGREHLKGFKVYHPEEELDPIIKMRTFMNHHFMQSGREIPHLNNTQDEKDNIKEFIRETFKRLDNNQVAFPPVRDNGDLSTIGYTTEVLRWFKPKITVVNMGAVDSCHSSYTSYLRSLHRADHAVGFLWNFIQNQIPEMANNTVMIVQPEHGRNYAPNPITDENDWFAYDHDSDANSRRIFNLVVGPGVDANLKVGGPNNPIGDAADVVPTIADIFGLKQQVMDAGLIHPVARSLFDRIT